MSYTVMFQHEPVFKKNLQMSRAEARHRRMELAVVIVKAHTEELAKIIGRDVPAEAIVPLADWVMTHLHVRKEVD